MNREFRVSFSGKVISVYDDRGEKMVPGNSEMLFFERDSSSIRISYILRNGFTYPYAGLLMLLSDSNGYFDCSGFDKLCLRISSSELSDCKLYLKVFDDKFSKRGDPMTERYLLKDLQINPSMNIREIPLREFVTPQWWYQKNNITMKNVSRVDLSRVLALQVESGATATTGITDTITISDMYFTKKVNKWLVIALVILFLFVVVFTVVKILPRKKGASPVIITYEKKDLGSYRDIDAQKIADYVAKNYSDSELSIISTGEALGMSQKKIAKIMVDVFKMSFRQYLTSIRLHEAKRLLLETDRLVIDIALAVGFNNVSHFNRVFKSALQVSPMEFRSGKLV